jgi:hypothetical protein
VDDRSFNLSVVGAVVAALVIVAVAAYVLAAVVRTSSRAPSQNSIGTITDDALPLPLTPSSIASVCRHVRGGCAKRDRRLRTIATS